MRFLLSFECIVSSGQLSASLHLMNKSHRNSRRYHFLLEVMSWNPVALVYPAKRFSLSFADLTVSCFGLIREGETWMIEESHIKQQLTSLKFSLQMQHLNIDLNPASMRLFNRVALTISHISKAAPFTKSSTWGGGFIGRAHILRP